MPIFPTGYSEKSTPEDADKILISDSASSNTIKQTSFTGIKNWLQGLASLTLNSLSITTSISMPNGSIDTDQLAGGAVTTDKLNLSKTTDGIWTKLDYGNWVEYVYSFSSWSAPNSFGAQGGTNWAQNRGNISLPNTLTVSDVRINADYFSQNSSWAGRSGPLKTYIRASSSSATSIDVIIGNPSSNSIANTNMSIIVAVRLIET